MKYLKDFRTHFKRMPAFTIRDVRIYLSSKNISENYLHILLHNLVETGEIKRLNKGVYTFHEESAVVGFAFSPFYYGLQEALSLRNLWDQETNPIIITPKRVRPGLREVLGTNVLIRRIERKMFFGFEMLRYYDFWIPVSDVEKTLIDFIYFREPLYPEVLEEMKKRIRKKVLESYLDRVSNSLKKRVIKKLGGLAL